MFPARLIAWLKLVRLQFYPMPVLVYTLGAVMAYRSHGQFNVPAFWLGLAMIFLVEMGSVFINEYYDVEADKQNTNAGLFNGGSRMIVEGRINVPVLRAVIIFVFILAGAAWYFMSRVSGGSSVVLGILFFVGLVLGPGYTMPPLKLCYRGLGEITVSIMFSPYLLLCGYTFQGGKWNDPLPWLIALPLSLAIFPAITLSEIPDAEADREAGKRTLAVRLGRERTVKLAAFLVFISALSWGMLYYFNVLSNWPWIGVPVVSLHAVILIFVLLKSIDTATFNRNMNRTMILALSYISWFGVFPLLFG
jgi:1,4-dihydroxy-2-naphthoate octaprenyltransferase